MRRGALPGRIGAVAGSDDFLQCAAFMGHIGFGAFHQVGDQFVAALELHVNLRKRVLKAIAQCHQLVVSQDGPDQDTTYQEQNNNQFFGHTTSFLADKGADLEARRRQRAVHF